MTATAPASAPSRKRVAEHRARMRAQGLKPKTFWLPDVNSEEFRIAAHKELLAIANSPAAKEDMDFIEAATNWIFD